MKIIALFSVLFACLNVFADSSHRTDSQTCYRMNPPADGSFVHPNLPSEVCLDTLAIDPRTQVATISSEFHANLFQEVRIRNFTQDGPRNFKFEVSSEFFEFREECCGNVDSLRLSISGQTDSTGVADVRKLQVMIEHAETRDYGHSGTDYLNYDYTLKD